MTNACRLQNLQTDRPRFIRLFGGVQKATRFKSLPVLPVSMPIPDDTRVE